jgi:hypothetical protein
MTIAFTICSNNYLAHAKTLGDSFLKHHPDAKFIIGLVDRYDENFDYGFFNAFEIIPVEDLQIKEFEELTNKYNIVELNTAVKPSYIHLLFNKYKADKVLYIDPDILVTSHFDEVLQILDNQNIVLTPHICTPIDDEFAPTDYHTLRGGIFNLGFIGLSGYENIKSFLDWWHERVVKYGFANFSKTMFYDQLWINYVPVLFDNYYILKHPGYNMANWNLHERVLSVNGNSTFLVNTKFPLRFFHFSSYRFDNPNVICAYLTRFDFTTRPDLKEIFSTYHSLLVQNKAETIKKLPVYFYPDLNKNKNQVEPSKSLPGKVYSRVKRSLKVLIKGHE